MPTLVDGTLLNQNIFSLGNYTYIACEYTQASTLYDNNTTSSGINITNAGNRDILIAQCNNVDGSYNWCARIGSTDNEGSINKIYADTTGVYILCGYRQNVTLFNADDSSFGTFTIGNSGIASGMMAKISLTGSWIYCNTIKSNVAISLISNIMLNGFVVLNDDVYVFISCLADSGNVVLVNTSGTTNFTIPLTTLGAICVVAKITNSSPYNWTWCGSVRRTGLAGFNVTFPNIYTDGTNLYVSGLSNGNTNFCQGVVTTATITATLVANDWIEFVAKLDLTGNWLGVAFLRTDNQSVVPIDGMYITHIGTDLYLSTSLNGNITFVNFGNNVSLLIQIPGSGFSKHIICKISTSGIFAWRSTITGNNSIVQSRDIKIFNNNILTSNYYTSENVSFLNSNDTQSGLSLTGNISTQAACSFGSININGVWNWINHYNSQSSGNMYANTQQLIIGNNYFYLPNSCIGNFNFYNNGSNSSTSTITAPIGPNNIVYPKYDVSGNLLKIPCIKPLVSGGSFVVTLPFSLNISNNNLYAANSYNPGQIGFYINNTLQTVPNVNISRFNNTSSTTDRNVTLAKFGNPEYTWNQNTAGTFNWNDSANWLLNGIATTEYPKYLTDIATFSVTSGSLVNQTILLNGTSITIDQFNVATNNVAITISSSNISLYKLNVNTITNTSNTPLLLSSDIIPTASFTANIASGSITFNNVILTTNTSMTISGILNVNGAISGAFSLTKLGTGLLILNGTNIYLGATIINNGSLSVNGSLLTSTITVNSSGTLQGIGSCGTTIVNGNLSPGNSIGTSTYTNLTLNSSSITTWEINANSILNRGTNYDAINVTNSLIINNGATLNIKYVNPSVNFSNPFWASNRDWLFINAVSGDTNIFTNITTDPLSNPLNPPLPGVMSTVRQGSNLMIHFTTNISPVIPCFAYNNIIKYTLPNDVVVVKKNIYNNEWIDINGLLLTKDHLINVDNKIIYAYQHTDIKEYINDELVDLISLDGRFIEVNGVSVATIKK